jgi:type VI secretion system secreted protein Hcp
MALNAYLRLTGATQGEIKGSVTQAGREDSIMVIAFEHGVRVPIDKATGNLKGKTKHKLLSITKEIEKSSVLLMQALISNELITSWELRFWQPSRSGKEVQFYTIELVNAHIVGIEQEMLNNKYPENMQHKEREHIAFTYEKIIWTFEDGGITAEDNWLQQSIRRRRRR